MAPSAVDFSPVTVKLQPNRALLNCDFETYKLSLSPLPRYEVELQDEAVVQRSKAQENDDFSLQFLSLQRMYNHAVGDLWVGNAVMYFVDAGFRVVCFSEADMRKAGMEEIKRTRAVLPKPHNLEKLRYHSTLSFPSADLAVVAAGSYLWLFNTGVRTADNSSDDQWELLEEFDFSDFSKEGFMIKDAKYAKNGGEEIVSCLLMHVDLNSSGGHILLPEYDSSSFVTILDWVTMSRHSSEGAWELLRRRRFGGKHAVLLAAIDKLAVNGEEALVLASEGAEFRMTFDSEGPVVALNGHAEEENGEEAEPLYEWNQNADSISVTMKLPGAVKKGDVAVKIEPRRLHVEALVLHETSAPEKIGFSGELASVVKPDESTWTLIPHEGKGWSHLEVVLSKGGEGAGGVRSWKELIKACKRGKETIDPALAAEIHEKLAHLTSETLASGTDQGAAMTQMEECDTLPPANSTLVRFLCYGKGEYRVSHKASLSAFQWLFATKIDEKSIPVPCLRHDVDAILWEFKETEPDNWGAVHLGTFDAFGYVCASKENRKYATCPPDLSYVAIADSKTHCYIYRKMCVVDSELKNRKTGKHMPTVAKQFVLTLKHEEVLGVSASNEGLFLLGESGLHYFALTGV